MSHILPQPDSNPRETTGKAAATSSTIYCSSIFFFFFCFWFRSVRSAFFSPHRIPKQFFKYFFWINFGNTNIVLDKVVNLDSIQVTPSNMLICEVCVVMITSGYALAPLRGTPRPAWKLIHIGIAQHLKSWYQTNKWKHRPLQLD